MKKKQSTKNKVNSLPLVQTIDQSIYFIRGQRVMIDEDLAKLYGVGTKVLNQSVSRNKNRFPEDFMFQLSKDEFADLRSQFVTSKSGGRRYMPYVFTEHGTVMLASVLKSERAIQMSIEIVKAFVSLRQVLACQKDMANQLVEIRSYMLKRANESDREFRKVWKAIEKLTTPSVKEKQNSIGFKCN